jgi:hypothetical protein
MALARSVFPVPGGPNNRTPLMECFARIPSEKYAGRSSGKVTSVCSINFVALGKITSLNSTEILDGFITVLMIRFS